MPIKNTSENAHTVKNMWESLQADNWSIDRCMTFCNYDNVTIVQEGTPILDKFFYYFEDKLIDYEVDEKYFYNPQWFAKEYYGDAGLDFLVLYFAGMTSNFDFNKKQIKIFPYSSLKEINQLFTQYRKDVDNSKKNPTLYESSKVKDIKTPVNYISNKKM